MENVLNRGLNFAIMPLKLNVTQVLVDFARFETSKLWHEFWADSTQAEFDKPIFIQNKTNLPKNHQTPTRLKTFLGAVKSELEDQPNRKSFKGLKELIVKT